MAGPFSALVAALRPARSGDRPRRRSLARLLADEARRALRLVLAPAVLGAALVAGATVFVVLGPSTPGPVLATAWRPVVATLLALVTAAFAHHLLVRRTGAGRWQDGDRSMPSGPAAAVAAVALVVAGTVVVANLLDLVTAGAAGPIPDTGGGLDGGLSVDPAIAVAGVLAVLAVVASAVGRRLGLPTSLLFLAIGVVAGRGGLGWVDGVTPTTIRNVAVVALVAILFDGGVTTSLEDLRRAAAPGALLATVGVMATAAVTAGAVVLVLPDVPTRTAWLVGAVVASTDAAALGNLLRNVRLPTRVRALLTVESGGNDPVAVLLTVGILATWDNPVPATQWLSFALWQLVGGVVAGVVVGAVGGRLLRRLVLPGTRKSPGRWPARSQPAPCPKPDLRHE